MRVEGKTPGKVNKIVIQGTQDSSTFHFDDSQGPPKNGFWVHVQGHTAASDNAAASVARQTKVYFSPPHDRVPPRPSVVDRKRKESVAPLVDDDDDDFVGVPQRTSACPSKTTSSAVPKMKKSKSSLSGHQHSEGVQNPCKRKNPNYRCAPNKVVEAINILKDEQKTKIRDYPFGPLLGLKLKGLENTKLLVFLMDRLDPDTLTLDFGSGKRLKITRHSIQCILGLPNRGRHIGVPDKQKQKEALSNLKRKLGIEQGVDIKVLDLINWIKKGGTDPFTIRCFSMILLGKLLVPGTPDYITGKEAALTDDMETLCMINWASVIYDDFLMAAKLWHSKKDCRNPSMHGCLMLLLVYYLDNLLGVKSTNPVLTPRIAHFSKKQLLDLIEEDKQVVNGVEMFGSLPLRSQEGTCYMEDTSTSTCVPPASETSPASHLVPPACIPSMQHHLAGFFNGFSERQQIAAKEALRRCDEDVGKLILQIGSTQMTAIQEIRRLLPDFQSCRTTPPPPHRGTVNHDTNESSPRATHRPPPPPHRGTVNVEADLHHQPASAHVANHPDDLLHEGSNIEVDTERPDDISITQITEGDGFDKLSGSQQAAFMHEFFSNPDIPQSSDNSPHKTPYDSPHEVLTNGVCKTCHDIDEIYEPDEELPYEEGDAYPSVAGEANNEEQNELYCPRPQVDADAPGKMASPRTPDKIRMMRYVVSDSSYEGVHAECRTIPPPVFDKTPNTHHDSLTPPIHGTKHVIETRGVPQQLRDAGLQKMASSNKLAHIPSPVFDETPEYLRHGSENSKQGWVSASTLFDRHGNGNLNQGFVSASTLFDQDKSDVYGRKTITSNSTLKVGSPSNVFSKLRNSENNVGCSRTVFYGTEPPKASSRNKNLSSKPLSPFKFSTNKVVCPIPIDSAYALRDIIVSDGSLMDAALISNASLGICSRGEALASSFMDSASTLIEIMNFWTECVRHDERLLAPQCRGYRIYLSWTLGSLLNCEELLPGQVYDSSVAVKYLSEHLHGVDPKHIKLIFWTYHHSNHFSVYCVNRVNTRIDVLDSIDWHKNGSSFEERNNPWGYRSIERLSDAFQTLTNKRFEDFSEWPIWSKEVPRQLPLGNSCASFAMKFLRHYDGEESQLRSSVEPLKENQYRAEELSYIIFHVLNEIRPLPVSLEKFRPRRTHM